jgi:hypothetical protein
MDSTTTIAQGVMDGLQRTMLHTLINFNYENNFRENTEHSPRHKGR